MPTVNCDTSACRYCRYYSPEGRRGGACQKLGVPVQAHWKACALAAPPFASHWPLENMVLVESLTWVPSSTYPTKNPDTRKALNVAQSSAI